MIERFRTWSKFFSWRWIGVAAGIAVIVAGGLEWQARQSLRERSRKDLLFQIGASDPRMVATALERLVEEFDERPERLLDRLAVGPSFRLDVLRFVDRGHLRSPRFFGYASYLLGDLAARDESLSGPAVALRDSLRVAFVEATGLVPPPEASDTVLNRRVLIAGGTFEMGSDTATGKRFGQGFAGSQKPARQITLAAYRIQEHEVTNQEYRRFDPQQRCPGKDRQPAVCVTWYDAMAYAAWLGGVLPTEAQWELAARGTDGRKYPWGTDDQSCDLAFHSDCVFQSSPGGVGGLANNLQKRLTARFGLSSLNGADTVMSRPLGATPEGVYDLVGNAWEWVSDWYGLYLPEDSLNPRGPESGSARQMRGGSYMQRPLRGSHRLGYNPDTDYGTSGFRVVWPVGRH